MKYVMFVALAEGVEFSTTFIQTVFGAVDIHCPVLMHPTPGK